MISAERQGRAGRQPSSSGRARNARHGASVTRACPVDQKEKKRADTEVPARKEETLLYRDRTQRRSGQIRVIFQGRRWAPGKHPGQH